MSDLPPPPPGGGAPPPPPPPNLTPPPGYAAYTESPMGSVTLKRVGGLARFAMIAVAVSAVASVATVAVGSMMSDEAETFLAGGTDSQGFVEDIAPYLLMSIVQGVATLASVVLVIIWMYRIAANHRSLQRVGTWAPGWAIGGWFLPPLLYIIPFLMFRELWKASDPDVPIGGEWRRSSVSPVVGAWFVAYSILPIIAMFTQGSEIANSLGADEDALAETLTSSQTGQWVNALVAVAGAVAFVSMANTLTARHRRLTGEARA